MAALLSGGCIDCVYVSVFEPVHVAPVNCPAILETGCEAPLTCCVVAEFGCIEACDEFTKPFCCICGETGELFPIHQIKMLKTLYRLFPLCVFFFIYQLEELLRWWNDLELELELERKLIRFVFDCKMMLD